MSIYPSAHVYDVDNDGYKLNAYADDSIFFYLSIPTHILHVSEWLWKL